MNGYLPASKAEVLALLASGAGPVVAGGTDAMVKRRRWSGLSAAIPAAAVYVANLKELQFVRRDALRLSIGAATPLENLLDHPMVPDTLRAAIRESASPAIRHVATLGGNLANASPAADPALALVLLGALVRLESASGTREIPAGAFATGPGKTVLRPDELIVAIDIPHAEFTHAVFVKVGGRKADAIAKVSFAGAVRLENGRVAAFRAAFGAVAKTIVRAETVEAACVGLTPAELREAWPRIRAAYAPLVVPIDDQRSTADYRRTVAFNLLFDFIASI